VKMLFMLLALLLPLHASSTNLSLLVCRCVFQGLTVLLNLTCAVE